MYHSITFGEKNTWDDWHLIPSSRPVFSPPQPNIRLLNIPGKSGSLDVTEAYGPVVYADRTGSFEFYVDHETEPRIWKNWVEAYQVISNYLHGQKMRAILEDDRDYYYEGRFTVNEWRSNPNFSTIVINYTVQPFKLSVMPYGSEWLWDELDLYDTHRKKLNPLGGLNLKFYGSQGASVQITGYGYRGIPEIECSKDNVQLYFDNKDPVTLSAGINKPRVAVITPGEHTLRFVGTGTVDVHYRGGSL